MKSQYLLLFIFTVCAWTAGYSLCTLLTTCEGENLQSCVNSAESILQNTNMTFPDDNETLQYVCRMWDDMTTCMYNYTKRCLTYKENLEFHQYFQEPMRSMKTVCLDKESTKEYFRHAHCIKKISTGENYCGPQYHLMIDQILSVNINTMKKICCALTDFKDCVMKVDVHNVCGDGPEQKNPRDGDIARYALKTLDKSLLAFVAHSCHQEGFHRPGKCKEDDEPQNYLGYLREARTEEPETTLKSFTRTTNDLESSATMTFTLKPLLVPMEPQERPEASIQVSITNTGDKGKSTPDLSSSKIKSPDFPKGFSNVSTSFRQEKTLPNLNSSSREKAVNMSTSLRDKINSTEKWRSQVVDEVLAAKVRNASLMFQNPLVNRSSATTSTAERRIDSGSNFNNLVPATRNTTEKPSTTSAPAATKSSANSRAGGGRSFNFLDTSQQAEENKLVPKITDFYNSSHAITKPTAIIGSNVKSNLENPPVTVRPTPTATVATPTTKRYTTTTTTTRSSSKTSSTTTTKTTTTAAIPEMSTEVPRSKSPRIVNNGNGNGNSLRDLNRALGLAPPSTTPRPSKKIDIKSRQNQPEQLQLSNTTKTEESKNSGNFSVSEVPIKVFMVWLSTFFV